MGIGRQPKDRRPLLRCWVAALSAAIVVLTGGLAAGEEAINVEDDEIYFDARSGTFSGPLPYGKEFKVVMIEPVGSTSELRMAQKQDGSCPQAPAGKQFGGAPTGAVVSGKQKLVFKLPKLFPLADYCFQGTVIQQRALTPDEQAEVASALVSSTRDLVEQRVAEIPPSRAQTAACAELEAATRDPGKDYPGRIKPCQLAHAAVELMPKGLARLNVYIDHLERPVPIREAIYRELLAEQGAAFRASVGELVDDLANAAGAEVTLRKQIEEAIKKLGAITDQDDPLYDPIPTVVKDEVCPTLSNAAEPGKTMYADICGKSRGAFVAALFKHKARLVNISPDGRTAPLADPKESVLGKFLRANQEAKVVETTPGQVKADLQRVLQGESTTVRLALVTELKKRMAPLENAADAGWPDPGGTRSLRVLQEVFAHVSRSVTALESMQKGEGIEKAVREHPAFKAFTARIFQNRVFVGKELTAQPTEGTREDLFPFYASLDVGAAALGFTGDTWDFGQYFGVNFYFAPVDPSEPLHTGRDDVSRSIKRRFSVTLGITTNGGQSESNQGVTGIVGSQFLMIGFGLRVLEFVRLSGGTFFFRKEDSNPLIDDPRLRVGGYAAASLDLAAFTLVAEGYRGLTGGDQ